MQLLHLGSRFIRFFSCSFLASGGDPLLGSGAKAGGCGGAHHALTAIFFLMRASFSCASASSALASSSACLLGSTSQYTS